MINLIVWFYEKLRVVLLTWNSSTNICICRQLKARMLEDSRTWGAIHTSMLNHIALQREVDSPSCVSFEICSWQYASDNQKVKIWQHFFPPASKNCFQKFFLILIWFLWDCFLSVELFFSKIFITRLVYVSCERKTIISLILMFD